MKVLMVTREMPYDKRYGLGKSLSPLMEGLALAGIPCIYFARSEAKQVILPWHLAWLPRILGLLGRTARLPLLLALEERLLVGMSSGVYSLARGISHIHLHDPWLAIGFLLSRMKCWGRKRRSVWGVTQHGYGSFANATRMDGLKQSAIQNTCLNYVEKRILLQASWVVVPTQRSMQQLLKDVGLDNAPKAWAVIPHPKPQTLVHSKSDARMAIGLSESLFLIVAIGRMVPLKRFDRIIEAFSDLAMEFPDLYLVMLGDGGEKMILEALADELNVASRIRILCVNDVSPYLSAADLYVSASETESFGLANLEALCAGLPCICSAVGGVPEVMGEAAVLYDPDQSNLADLLRSVLENPDWRDQLVKKAREVSSKWPTQEVVAQKYLQLFQLSLPNES